MGHWKRPESVPVPQVWRRFQGKKPMGKNNKIPKFRVQDLTEDLRETVVNSMLTFFLRDEPTCGNKGINQDEEAVKEFKQIWNEVCDQKLVLVCLLENKDELGDESLPVFAGCNMTHYLASDHEETKLSSPLARTVFQILEDCHAAVDCFKRYNVDGYMYALGLLVDPIYRGQGIGLEILKARFDLGKAVGIKLTVTVFTAIESQVIAEKAGFETVYEADYADYKDKDGNSLFQGIKPKSAKLMAVRIE